MTTDVSSESKAASISATEVEQLRSALRGELLEAGDEGYDDARQIWNGMIDKRPALIARVTGVADVIASVRFARGHDLLLAVRGGGHNIAGKALVDGGLVVDLSQLTSVRIDPEHRRAFVEPGATLGDFDHEAQAFGLATPLGVNSTTGVAGLTLGGGFGWLTRKHGLSSDNLLSVDLVTADGTLVHADATQHADLFWAVRGGGGNFGIVTSFEFRLHPVGPELLSGLIVFPLEQARSVLGQYREFTKAAPDDLVVWAVMRKAPPLPFLPEEVHGTEILALALLYAGDPEEGEELVATLRSFGTTVGEHVGVQPYTAWQAAFDPLLTEGARNYWKSHNFTELSDGALDILADFAGRLPSDETEIFIAHLGGAASRIDVEATAYPHRDAEFVMNVHGRWREPSDDDAVIGWARELFDATAPHASGSVYVNFLTEDEADRVEAAYGPNYGRLTAVKQRFDPDNFFRINQNVAATE